VVFEASAQLPLNVAFRLLVDIPPAQISDEPRQAMSFFLT
jgi:hypothetical protein